VKRSRRTGLGRHGAIADEAGDPLDGLVNLFDIGMILAVAFLVAGLAVTLHGKHQRPARGAAAAEGQERVLPNPASAPQASGRGEPVGQVYRLPDGRLVYVKRPRG
jgi:hypothetical protein